MFLFISECSTLIESSRCSEEFSRGGGIYKNEIDQRIGGVFEIRLFVVGGAG